MLKWLSGILATVLSGWILHDRLLHRLRSWSWHFLNSDISQGSVVTQLRCGKIISELFVANLLVNLPVKEVWKSVNIWRSYGQYCTALFFLTHSVDFLNLGSDEKSTLAGREFHTLRIRSVKKLHRFLDSHTVLYTAYMDALSKVMM